ncbi:CRISPR-associated exonuclease Cas4 [Peptoclostridium litorale DSM 5388]|uniref:CRISPR-associated exonuclease Cas4 n=1 Tax=Peptoclostridium litorale DSM 5388 TaxID=1121324 RepID=A0A069RNF6_PEPLI|nr:CRISPR-associated protein Cas4 [Peptoclostridium litorale]KDR95717.1 CRISPR-associated exonuclease Cas4 [Peptoclostridium litorale DSM 5388]SIO22703.1 CRISPR-associated exonuclease Cas4 [Peptoclostridium litorale DSM 5388]
MEKDITGMDIYYYNVCIKKLWYYSKSISMEHGNEDVSIGKMLDSDSYKNEYKNIRINNTINIDFIKSKREIHEIKKSNSIENAFIWQVKYYIYYLRGNGVEVNKGVIDYPLLKKKIDVFLEKTDYERIENMITRINFIKSSPVPCQVEKMKICGKCAYYDLCFI